MTRLGQARYRTTPKREQALRVRRCRANSAASNPTRSEISDRFQRHVLPRGSRSHCSMPGIQSARYECPRRAVSLLEQMPAEKVGTARRINANIDAIDTFSNMLDDLSFGDATPSLAPNSAPLLQISNIQVSVRPEVLLKSPGSKAGPLLGSVKLHFPRTFSLTEKTSGYVSALLQEWHKTHQPDNGMPHGPICYVVDVGAKRVWPGVKSTTARMKDISSHCQNIAALWPTIKLKD